MSDEPDVLHVEIRTVEQGGHVVRFVEIVEPPPVRWRVVEQHTAPRQPRLRLNPVSDA